MLEVIKCKCIEVTLDEISQKLTLVPTNENVSKSGILMYAPIGISMSKESKLYKQVNPGDLITLTIDLDISEEKLNNNWFEEIPSWNKDIKIDNDTKIDLQ